MDNRGACAHCAHAQTIKTEKSRVVYTGPYTGSGTGYCAKIEGLSFVPRDEPDMSLQSKTCGYWQQKK